MGDGLEEGTGWVYKAVPVLCWSLESVSSSALLAVRWLDLDLGLWSGILHGRPSHPLLTLSLILYSPSALTRCDLPRQTFTPLSGLAAVPVYPAALQSFHRSALAWTWSTSTPCVVVSYCAEHLLRQAGAMHEIPRPRLLHSCRAASLFRHLRFLVIQHREQSPPFPRLTRYVPSQVATQTCGLVSLPSAHTGPSPLLAHQLSREPLPKRRVTSPTLLSLPRETNICVCRAMHAPFVFVWGNRAH